jgi:hypothetical protein
MEMNEPEDEDVWQICTWCDGCGYDIMDNNLDLTDIDYDEPCPECGGMGEVETNDR